MPTATADLWSLNFFLVDLSLMLMHAWSPSIRLVHLHMFFTKKLLLFIQLLNRGTKKKYPRSALRCTVRKNQLPDFQFSRIKVVGKLRRSVASMVSQVYLYFTSRNRNRVETS